MLAEHQSLQLESQAPLSLADQALRTWQANPHLALCFADVGAFTQAFIVQRREFTQAKQDAAEWTDRSDQAQRSLALSRLQLLRNPMGTSEHLKTVERKGPRLVLWIYGPIGDEGLKANEICAALQDHRDARAIVLRIASGGGYVDSTLAIAEAIIRHPAKSIGIVDRYAYSGASTLASVCNRVLIRRNATWMTHPSWATHSGNADSLLNKICSLRGTDQRLAGLCARRRNISAPDFYKLMSRSEYLTAEESVALGVCDSIISELPINWDQPEEANP